MSWVDENGDEWFDFFDRADMERFDAVVEKMEQQQAPEPNGTAIQ